MQFQIKIANLKRRLKEASKNRDREMAHIEADKVLCELLELLGYGDIVADYKRIDKWEAIRELQAALMLQSRVNVDLAMENMQMKSNQSWSKAT